MCVCVCFNALFVVFAFHCVSVGISKKSTTKCCSCRGESFFLLFPGGAGGGIYSILKFVWWVWSVIRASTSSPPVSNLHFFSSSKTSETQGHHSRLRWATMLLLRSAGAAAAGHGAAALWTPDAAICASVLVECHCNNAPSSAFIKGVQHSKGSPLLVG